MDVVHHHAPSKENYKEMLKDIEEHIKQLDGDITSYTNVKNEETTARSPFSMENFATKSSRETNQRVESNPYGKECMVILLPLLTSSLRGAKMDLSKIVALSMLIDFAKHLSNDVILQRVLPYIMNILRNPDNEYNSVVANVGLFICLFHL